MNEIWGSLLRNALRVRRTLWTNEVRNRKPVDVFRRQALASAVALIADPAAAQRSELNSSRWLPSIREEIRLRPILLTAFTLVGYASPGDLGIGALYVRGSRSGLSAIQDGGGNWWNLSCNQEANVGWFGAAGDGLSDDTIAIQAAFDAQQIHAYKSVYFPACAGGYRVSSHITLYGNNWTIHGAGKFSSVLLSEVDGDIFRIDTSMRSANLGEIANLGFVWTGQSPPAAATAVRIYNSGVVSSTGHGATNWQFRSLMFRGVRYGVRLCAAQLTMWKGTAQIAAYGHLEFLDFHCPYTPTPLYEVVAFDAGPGAHNVFRGGTWAASNACIKMGDGGATSGVGDQLIEGCHLIDAAYGVYILGPSSAGIYNKNVTISGCQFDGISVNTVYLSNMSAFRIVSNNSTSAVGFALPGCSAYKVENRFDESSEYALREKTVARGVGSVDLFAVLGPQASVQKRCCVYVELFLDVFVAGAGNCTGAWAGHVSFAAMGEALSVPLASGFAGSSARYVSLNISAASVNRIRFTVNFNDTLGPAVVNGDYRITGSQYIVEEL